MRMKAPDKLFLIAAGIGVFAAIAHEIVGAPSVLVPLENRNLPAKVIWLHHFSWHVGTVAVLTMASLFLLAVWHPLGKIFALIATVMSAALAVLGIALATFGNPAIWQTPAPYPWEVIAVLGSVGILAGASNESRHSNNDKRSRPC